MARLEDQTVAALDEARGWANVQDIATGDALLWALLPQLAISLVGHEPSPTTPRRVADGRNAIRALSRRRGPQTIRVGPYLFASTSGQTLRVLEPIIVALEGLHRARSPQSLPTLRVHEFIRLRRRAAALTRDVNEDLARRGFECPTDTYEAIVEAAVIGARAERLFDADPPSALVIASQHNAATRALVAAAHNHGGIHTVYAPHAPVAHNPAYRDLPVHHALLRGQAEVGFYQALGASADRLTIVGDPSIPNPPTGAPPESNTVVFAAPVRPTDELAALIRVVAEAGLGSVEVSPHPRGDAAALRRLCPPEWTFNPFPSTYQRLATQGAASVVQDDSGVGLEALGLGIAVVNLLFPGRGASYPYLESPLVAIAHDSDDIRRAVEGRLSAPEAAGARREFAHSWCSCVGPEAAHRAAELLHDIVARNVPPAMLIDGWAPITS